MEDHDLQRLVDSLRCQSCGHRYPPDNVTVLGEEEGLWLLRAVCGSCHVSSLVAAIIREEEAVTDLTSAERARFRDLGPVNAEDVIDAHEFLARFRGDITRLFPPRPE